jgi:hypothetical protein
MNLLKVIVTIGLGVCFLLAALGGCGHRGEAFGPHVIEVTAVGLSLRGPSETPEGWTTVRFTNQSGMIHLAMFDVPPEGVDAFRMKRELVEPFQDYLDALVNRDDAGMQTALESFPSWMPELYYLGGPGLLSSGQTSEATVNLKPGRYVLECYVKTNGVWHTYNPDPDTLGMVLEIEVTKSDAPTSPPYHDATLQLRNDGLELTQGVLKSGFNRIKVEFIEQQTFENFLGNDVHVVRLDEDGDLNRAAEWMDWRKPAGLQTPAPVTFLGGLNDMPEGSVGYFTVNLSPGEFAFITESPDPVGQGLVLQFSID